MSLVARQAGQISLLKALTCIMFTIFAMTTVSVGVIIPQVIRDFSLNMTVAGGFQYATMAGISVAALCLGFLADRWGRKPTIVLGLLLYAISCAFFGVGQDFFALVALLFAGGVGIGVFQTGALALIGDLSRSTKEHTANMNLVEVFFGLGAIIGPAIAASLLHWGASWRWLYAIAACACALLVAAVSVSRYPPAPKAAISESRPRGHFALLGDRYALGFGFAIFLYVGAETAVYVWAPTYLLGYRGPLAGAVPYAVSLYGVLRIAGQFTATRLLTRCRWTLVLALSCCSVVACFAAAAFFGRGVAAITLPLSGAFMSLIYPTITSKGISCFEKARHGTMAGVLLFFTCLSAVLSPLAMAALSDVMGDVKYSLYLATVMITVLTGLALFNLGVDPIKTRLVTRDSEDYATTH